MSTASESRLKPKNHATIALLSVIAFALAASRASLHTLATWETRLLLDIYNLPTGWTPLFRIITQFGSLWAVLFLAWAVWLKKQKRLAIRLLFNGLLAVLAAEYFKQIVARPRPDVLLAGLHQPGYTSVDAYGFPSVHTTVITVLSLTLLPYLPVRYRWLCGMAIILVAFSRLYLGAHAPLDVLGGFSLGVAIVSLQHTVKAVRYQKSQIKRKLNSRERLKV